MTGGAGFSRDAMSRGKSNRANRTSQRAKFKEGQSTYLGNNQPLNFKEVSAEELKKIKLDIQEKAKKERTQHLMLGIVLGTLFVIAGLLLLL